MGKRLFGWELAGFLWTGLAGTVLHFFYDWTGRAAWAMAFSAVTLVQAFFRGRQYPDLFAVRGITAPLGTAAIPLAYYTYTGALGLHALWADILIFFLADAGLFWLDYRLLRRGAVGSGWRQVAGLALLWAVLFAFVWCSYQPPALPIFLE